ncbi:MAG: MarR family winged helix-turn-helix transcriptional regulator [Burkholderiales bacterium]
MTKLASRGRKTEKARRSVAIARSTHTKVAPVHRVAAHLARRFHQVCLGVLAEVTEPHDLSPLKFAVLAALHDQPGLDQRRLAQRLGVDAVTTGHVVDELEKNHLLDRQVHPDDRRARVLSLTQAGLELRLRLRPALADAHIRILAPLNQREQATLIALLTRVVEGNESYAKPGNGRRRPRRGAAALEQKL